MGGIAWRRHIEEKIVRKRLRFFARRFRVYRFKSANEVDIQHPDWLDWLGTRMAQRVMSQGSPWRSQRKRYSPNRGSEWHEWTTIGKSRIADKREFRYIMKEYYED